MAVEVILGFDDDGLSVFTGNDDALAKLRLALEELPLRLTDSVKDSSRKDYFFLL